MPDPEPGSSTGKWERNEVGEGKRGMVDPTTFPEQTEDLSRSFHGVVETNPTRLGGSYQPGDSTAAGFDQGLESPGDAGDSGRRSSGSNLRMYPES
jgi:hypothetical protein